MEALLRNAAKRESVCFSADLVFIQNGMLQPWLDSVGLSSATQALVFFAVAKLGDAPTDGVTDKNPEGLTAVCGKHAEAFAARLHRAGLKCHVLGAEEYKVAMLEKLVWIWCGSGDVNSAARAQALLRCSTLSRTTQDCAVDVLAAPCCTPRQCRRCDRVIAALRGDRRGTDTTLRVCLQRLHARGCTSRRLHRRGGRARAQWRGVLARANALRLVRMPRTADDM